MGPDAHVGMKHRGRLRTGQMTRKGRTRFEERLANITRDASPPGNRAMLPT